jgi:hypothetical protein
MNCERRGVLSGMRARCSVRLSVMRLYDKARRCFRSGQRPCALQFYGGVENDTPT